MNTSILIHIFTLVDNSVNLFLIFNFGVGYGNIFLCYGVILVVLFCFNTEQGDFQPGVAKALNAQYCIIKQKHRWTLLPPLFTMTIKL